MTIEPDLISIPQEARGHLIADFGLSTRLTHALRSNRLVLLGDLPGATLGKFLKIANCRKKTVSDLGELARAVQQSKQPFASSEPNGTAGVLRNPKARRIAGNTVEESQTEENRDVFEIPVRLQELNGLELPVPVRLEGVLKREGITRLGDLHGCDLKKFRVQNFGRRTKQELIRLVERATAGEFQADEEFQAENLLYGYYSLKRYTNATLTRCLFLWHQPEGLTNLEQLRLFDTLQFVPVELQFFVQS